MPWMLADAMLIVTATSELRLKVVLSSAFVLIDTASSWITL
jgi:hypothetical protein